MKRVRAVGAAPELSIVVPTYNRGAALARTLTSVAKSGLGNLAGVEIIVVDDGSDVPVHPDALSTLQGWPVRLLRQENGGPAAARNAGFRMARGRVLLFLDDDVLVPAGLIARHVRYHDEAAHVVVQGFCDWAAPAKPDAVFRALARLNWQRPIHDARAVPASLVASAQLSVERADFLARAGVYDGELTIPGAEEYELTYRLRSEGVPLLSGSDLIAVHDSAVSMIGLCRQQYKHGLACAEVAKRRPNTLKLHDLAVIIDRARSLSERWPRRPRAAMSALASTAAGRRTLLTIAQWGARSLPQSDRLWPLYLSAIASHFLGGVRDGLERFGLSAHRR